jgi:hypothetical protein
MHRVLRLSNRANKEEPSLTPAMCTTSDVSLAMPPPFAPSNHGVAYHFLMAVKSMPRIGLGMMYSLFTTCHGPGRAAVEPRGAEAIVTSRLRVFCPGPGVYPSWYAGLWLKPGLQPCQLNCMLRKLWTACYCHLSLIVTGCCPLAFPFPKLQSSAYRYS